MSVNYVRVINNQVINRSILIDKVDRSQGNFSGYANITKQKIYIPYVNPLDVTVKGYLDLVPTDEVLLSYNIGGIKGLDDEGYINSLRVDSDTIVAPIITVGSLTGSDVSLTGTTFTSINPDVTSVILTNLVGQTQKIPESVFVTFTGVSIIFPDSAVTIGTPDAGWKAQVFANSKLSNTYTFA